jgi:L-iditol 2-dehydrogenase
MVSSATNTCAVLYGATDLRIEHRPIRAPPPGHAQIRVMATGLCGSDLHYYQKGANGDFQLQAPMCLGHESAGIVTAVGQGVQHLQVGDRVAIECGVNCHNCKYCLDGRYNLCTQMSFCSSAKTFPHRDGTLQSVVNHPADLLHPLPSSVTYEQAALAEPLSVVLHAVRRGNFQRGQSVLVLGAGPVGLLACALAKASGASRVVACDINKSRLALAAINGLAQEVFCLSPAPPSPLSRAAKSGAATPRSGTATPATPQRYSFEEAMALYEQEVARKLDHSKRQAQMVMTESRMPQGFDMVFECTGAEACMQIAIQAATIGGKVMYVGMGKGTPVLPLSSAACREVDLLGVFRYADTYPEALGLLASGSLDGAEEIITHRLPLERTKEAFDLMLQGRDESGGLVMKVMVGPNY